MYHQCFRPFDISAQKQFAFKLVYDWRNNTNFGKTLGKSKLILKIYYHTCNGLSEWTGLLARLILISVKFWTRVSTSIWNSVFTKSCLPITLVLWVIRGCLSHISSSKSPMQVPSRAQLAGHPPCKSWPAQMSETWEEILAAISSEL